SAAGRRRNARTSTTAGCSTACSTRSTDKGGQGRTCLLFGVAPCWHSLLATAVTAGWTHWWRHLPPRRAYEDCTTPAKRHSRFRADHGLYRLLPRADSAAADSGAAAVYGANELVRFLGRRERPPGRGFLPAFVRRVLPGREP